MTEISDKINFQEMSFEELGKYLFMDVDSFGEMMKERSFRELDRLLYCAEELEAAAVGGAASVGRFCLYDGGSKDFDIDAIRGKMAIIESRLKAVAPCLCDAVYHGPYRGERLPGCGELDDCCGDCECTRGGCVRGKTVCLAALHYGERWECPNCEGNGGCRS